MNLSQKLYYKSYNSGKKFMIWLHSFHVDKFIQ
jgi:hypothetical protein